MTPRTTLRCRIGWHRWTTTIRYSHPFRICTHCRKLAPPRREAR